jgi:hypothetical protein
MFNYFMTERAAEKQNFHVFVLLLSLKISLLPLCSPCPLWLILFLGLGFERKILTEQFAQNKVI